MNSLLQALYHTNALRRAVFIMPTETDDRKTGVALALQVSVGRPNPILLLCILRFFAVVESSGRKRDSTFGYCAGLVFCAAPLVGTKGKRKERERET